MITAKYIESCLVMQQSAERQIEKTIGSWEAYHPAFAGAVRVLLRNFETLRKDAAMAVAIGDFAGALRLVQQLTTICMHWVEKYVSALLVEEPEHRALAAYFHEAAKSAGVTFVDELIIKAGEPWAILPVFPTVPLLMTPRIHSRMFADLPVFYHELGHLVSRKDGSLLDAMRKAVVDHFQQVRGQGLALTPSVRAKRDEDVNRAEAYWADPRLDETFGDLFATYICGPAFCFNWLDTTLRYPQNPFMVNPADEHPPAAFRYLCCVNMLDSRFANDSFVVGLKQLWDDSINLFQFAPIPTDQPQYAMACSPELSKALVGTVRRELALRGFIEYAGPVPTVQQAKAYAGTELRELANACAVNQLHNSADYQQWEDQRLQDCLKAVP